jgi:hypothetical protein
MTNRAITRVSRLPMSGEPSNITLSLNLRLRFKA